jgi:hypothetical protein
MSSKVEQIGYYARDVHGNLHQFEWGKVTNSFYIIDRKDMRKDGVKIIPADPKDYEILEIGFYHDK